MNKFNIGDTVLYIGSNDEWNHEDCVGAEYEVKKVYPPVYGIYYYDLETTAKNYNPIEDYHYKEVWSVREYQIKNISL